MSAVVMLSGEDTIPASPPLLSQEIEEPTSYVEIEGDDMLSQIASNIEATCYFGRECTELPAPPPLKRVKKSDMEEMDKLGAEDGVEEIFKLKGGDEVKEIVNFGGDEVPTSQPLNPGSATFVTAKEYILIVAEERLKKINYLENELKCMYSENHELHEKHRKNKELVYALENAAVRAAVLIEDAEQLWARLVEAAASSRHDR